MTISGEIIGFAIAFISGLMYFERRMTRVETKVDLIYEHVTGNTCPVIVKGDT